MKITFIIITDTFIIITEPEIIVYLEMCYEGCTGILKTTLEKSNIWVTNHTHNPDNKNYMI